MKQTEIETSKETKEDESRLDLVLAIAPATILGGVLMFLSHIS